MTNERKNIILIIGIISFGLLLVGGTYAWLTFDATVTNGNYDAGTTCFDIDYVSEGNITGVMFQSSTPKGGLSSSVSLNVKSTCSVEGTGTIKLNVDSSTGSILLSEGALKYAVYEDVDSEPIASGSITSTGNRTLYSGFNISSTAKTYYVYVWLDGNIADNDYVNIPFSGYIHATATQIG